MSVMILDEGSEDETVQIVQKIAMKQGEVSLLENNAQLERILENLDGSSYHIEILDEEKTRRQTASM
jgi:ribosome assembly protein YihI (activator of Der GTPase)